jgi:hypothetical protein
VKKVILRKHKDNIKKPEKVIIPEEKVEDTTD